MRPLLPPPSMNDDDPDPWRRRVVLLSKCPEDGRRWVQLRRGRVWVPPRQHLAVEAARSRMSAAAIFEDAEADLVGGGMLLAPAALVAGGRHQCGQDGGGVYDDAVEPEPVVGVTALTAPKTFLSGESEKTSARIKIRMPPPRRSRPKEPGAVAVTDPRRVSCYNECDSSYNECEEEDHGDTSFANGGRELVDQDQLSNFDEKEEAAPSIEEGGGGGGRIPSMCACKSRRVSTASPVLSSLAESASASAASGTTTTETPEDESEGGGESTEERRGPGRRKDGTPSEETTAPPGQSAAGAPVPSPSLSSVAPTAIGRGLPGAPASASNYPLAQEYLRRAAIAADTAAAAEGALRQPPSGSAEDGSGGLPSSARRQTTTDTGSLIVSQLLAELTRRGGAPSSLPQAAAAAAAALNAPAPSTAQGGDAGVPPHLTLEAELLRTRERERIEIERRLDIERRKDLILLEQRGGRAALPPPASAPAPSLPPAAAGGAGPSPPRRRGSLLADLAHAAAAAAPLPAAPPPRRADLEPRQMSWDGGATTQMHRGRPPTAAVDSLRRSSLPHSAPNTNGNGNINGAPRPYSTLIHRGDLPGVKRPPPPSSADKDRALLAKKIRQRRGSGDGGGGGVGGASAPETRRRFSNNAAAGAAQQYKPRAPSPVGQLQRPVTDDDVKRRLKGKGERASKYVPRTLVVHKPYRDWSRELPPPEEAAIDDLSGSGNVNGTAAPGASASQTRGGIAFVFPARLHAVLELLEREGRAGAIASWRSHGRAFAVHDPDRFVQLWPAAVSQSGYSQGGGNNMKFSSFQRQLNLYGFLRISAGTDKRCYYHPMFLRGRRFLSHRIPRIRLKGNKCRAGNNPDDEPDFYQMEPVRPLHEVAAEEAAAAIAATAGGGFGGGTPPSLPPPPNPSTPSLPPMNIAPRPSDASADAAGVECTGMPPPDAMNVRHYVHS